MSLPWMVHAACRGLPLAIFFPERGETAAAARAICDTCPAWGACLDFAVSDDAPDDGVVAGLTGIERRRLRAELRRQEDRPSSPTPRRRRGPELLPAFPIVTAVAGPEAWTRTELLEARAAAE